MRKLIKTAVYILLIVVIVAVIAAVLLVKFVDPNDFKTQITTKVRKASGYQVILAGPLSWRFLPRPGVEARDVTIAAAPGFSKPLAQVKLAAVEAALLPLIFGNIQINAVKLNGATLHFQRNRQGVENWVMPQTDKQSKPTTAAKSEQTATDNLDAIKIKHIGIKDAAVTWQDDQAGKTITIQKFVFEGQDIEAGVMFPVSSHFEVLMAGAQKAIAVKLQARLKFDPSKADYAMKNLKLNVGDTTLSGYFNSEGRVPMNVDFAFVVNQLNLDQWGSKAKSAKPSNASSNQTATQPSVANKTKSELIPVDFLRNLNGKGSLAIDRLTMQNLTFKNLKAVVKATPGLIKLAPITAEGYGGSVSSELSIDVRQAQPLLLGKEVGKNIQAGPLFQDFVGMKRISGTMNYGANVTARGQNVDAWLRSLNGVMNFDFEKGALEGMDLNYMSQSAVALFKRQSSPEKSKNTGRTTFDKMSFTSTVRNGVIKTNDMMVDATGMRVTAKGSADLVSQAIDFDILVNLTALDADEKIQQLQRSAGGIPLTLQGTFTNYHLKPDTTAITTAIGKSFLESESSKIKEKYRGLFGR